MLDQLVIKGGHVVSGPSMSSVSSSHLQPGFLLLPLKSSPMIRCHQQSPRHILTHQRTLQILSVGPWLLTLPPPTHSPHSKRRACSKWPLHCVTTRIKTLPHVPTAAGIKWKGWLLATSPKPSSSPSLLGPSPLRACLTPGSLLPLEMHACHPSACSLFPREAPCLLLCPRQMSKASWRRPF